jgi:hypothetical protein
MKVTMCIALAAAGLASVGAHADEANGTIDKAKIPKAAIIAPKGPVKPGGPWNEFSFTGPGSAAKGCAPADPAGLGCQPSSAGNSHFVGAPPWTFTAPSDGATLIVTDAFQKGDVFEVFDNGNPIGSTASVPMNATSCGSDPEPCSTDPAVSHRAFDLGPGAHSITIKATASPYQQGAAYFRIDDKREHFVCYRVKQEGESRPHTVATQDQFGAERLEVGTPELLCVPASKTVIK